MRRDCELIVVGGSWGGLDAASALLAAVPADEVLPAVAIVLHRNARSGDALPRALSVRSGRSVVEALDKAPIEPGRIYVAPADYHLLVEPSYFALSVDEPVSYSRPSIDLLFESAAASYRERVVAVLLSGTGRDGTAGMVEVKRRGGFTVAQDPADAERGEMPAAAIAEGAVDEIVPLSAIGQFLAERSAV